MNKTEVLALLKANQNERGIENFKKHAVDSGLKSFGIGLTQLRKLAKKIGRNHKLSAQLWKSKIYDAKIISLLIDDPKLITEEQAEIQVEQLNAGMLAHVFASCDATLAKTPFAFELACRWVESDDVERQSCGYCLLYELSKKNVAGMDDEFCLSLIADILETIDEQPTRVRTAMGGALLGIGKRNRTLNQAALQASKTIGPISYGEDYNCEPLDLVKHLTSDYLKKKLKV